MKYLILIAIIIGLLALVITLVMKKNSQVPSKPAGYHINVIDETIANEDYRRVLYTGPQTQLVVMSIPKGGESGGETHKYTEQTLFFLSGSGQGELDHKQFEIRPGDVVVVPKGTEHNFWNTGDLPLKIYTVYAPPNHLDRLVEKTKEEADKNTADEAVGERAPR